MEFRQRLRMANTMELNSLLIVYVQNLGRSKATQHIGRDRQRTIRSMSRKRVYLIYHSWSGLDRLCSGYWQECGFSGWLGKRGRRPVEDHTRRTSVQSQRHTAPQSIELSVSRRSCRILRSHAPWMRGDPDGRGKLNANEPVALVKVAV